MESKRLKSVLMFSFSILSSILSYFESYNLISVKIKFSKRFKRRKWKMNLGWEWNQNFSSSLTVTRRLRFGQLKWNWRITIGAIECEREREQATGFGYYKTFHQLNFQTKRRDKDEQIFCYELSGSCNKRWRRRRGLIRKVLIGKASEIPF